MATEKIYISILVLIVAILIPYSAGSVNPADGTLKVSPVNVDMLGRSGRTLFVVEVPSDVMGTLAIANSGNAGLEASGACLLRRDSKSTGIDSIPLKVRMLRGGRSCELVASEMPDTGRYELQLPHGLFEIFPATYEDVDTIDIPEELLQNLSVGGAWHVKGTKWSGPGLFAFHDDDGVDGVVYRPSADHPYGYFTILYPMLESLGLRGCISLEGRRAGWTSQGGGVNDNAKIAKRLQNERGWEIMSHSMSCLGEIRNNWVVDRLDSKLADRILAEADCKGIENPATTTVYCREDGLQYSAMDDAGGWTESPRRLIKPFAADYESRQVILYNPDYDAEYQWGEWFDKAKESGMESRAWVMHNGMSCHANIPDIAQFSPWGFVDVWPAVYNVPPLMTAATRMLCEGQMFEGTPAESSTDNTYNQQQYRWLRGKIDEARGCGGWIVMGMHTYRRCWKNYLPGSLKSEGGTYPDEWVLPMEGVDPLRDPLTPPSRLGIKDWSEWYPCPGTRLRMMWDLLKYAKESGMRHVTSSEGFREIGNRKSAGYFTKGDKYGYDVDGIEGTRMLYPHYVEGANGEVYYYSSVKSAAISVECAVEEEDGGRRYISGKDIPGVSVDAFSVSGQRLRVAVPDQLPAGLWIVDGKKILVK